MSPRKTTPETPLALRSRIYAQVEEEREKQDREYGGSEHDDIHPREDWVGFLTLHVNRARLAAKGSTYRYQLIRVIALAVAAIEVYDRKVARGETE